jgi:hypothetical protein
LESRIEGASVACVELRRLASEEMFSLMESVKVSDDQRHQPPEKDCEEYKEVGSKWSSEFDLHIPGCVSDKQWAVLKRYGPRTAQQFRKYEK